MAAPQADRAPPDRVLTDFRSEAEPARWRTVLDGVMGGRSSGRFVVEEARLIFTGVLNTDGGGFSSVRRPSSDLKLGQPGEEGIRLRVRGDGRTYTLRLRQPIDDRRFAASYRAKFASRKGTDWQDVFVPYEQLIPTWRGRRLDLPAVRPSEVDEIGISIDDDIDGPFRIEVGEIATFGAFEFTDYRDERRPLVVFASGADDPRLEQQIAAVRDATDGFEERDMVLVVVLDAGESFAGSRPLSEDACAALRERFAQSRKSADDGFITLLVGKDGDVKRTAVEPLETADLFAQIDRMPMRMREARRRRD